MMETILILCDYAEAVNGKLYIMGGGWTMCPPGPRNMSVAVRILVPWGETNIRHTLTLMLQDDSGGIVELGDPPVKVQHEGGFEVGRPPGVPAGAELDFTAVMGFMGLPLEPGKSYRWQLEINGEPSAHASFRTTA